MRLIRCIRHMLKHSAFSEMHFQRKSKAEDYYSKESNTKLNIFLLIAIVLCCGITMIGVKANAIHNTEVQKGIAKEIIRFHVIANSDSDSDQALKLKVKDELVKRLAPLLEQSSSITESRSILNNNMDYIQQIAEEIIQKNGYHYPVRVSLENCYFPLKVYGNYEFPPGNYEALRVRIGEAAGRNWWCVMFPPLCFVDDTYSVVDSKTDKKLKHLLTEEEYNTLIIKKKPVKVKFKIWESIKHLTK